MISSSFLLSDEWRRLILPRLKAQLDSDDDSVSDRATEGTQSTRHWDVSDGKRAPLDVEYTAETSIGCVNVSESLEDFEMMIPLL